MRSTRSLVVRRSHDVGADPGNERFPHRTQAATPPRSASDLSVAEGMTILGGAEVLM